MFTIAITNVLVTLCYAIPGFLLGKLKKADGAHLSTLSAVLVYVCSPCMIIGAMWKSKPTAQELMSMGLFCSIVLLLQTAFMLVLFLIFRKKFDDGKYRILTRASVMGNCGFFGLPIVKALFPGNTLVMSYSCLASVALNLLSFTVGVFCVTGDKSKVNLVKGIFNPNTLGLIVGFAFAFLGVRELLPEAFVTALELVGNSSTPICMIILGVRLACVPFGKLFARPFVYLTCFMKLVVFPLFCYAAVYFLPIDDVLKASVLVLTSVPCASMILNIAELYDGERELSANSVLLSALLCFITIPLLTLLVQ